MKAEDGEKFRKFRAVGGPSVEWPLFRRKVGRVFAHPREC